ncbi:MAG: cystathionine gamma-synthase [Methyloligellaceae bacterium]
MTSSTDNWARSTLAVQALHKINEATGAVVPGIEPASTFARGPGYELIGATSYARYTNPTARIVEEVLTAIEGAADALVFNAGMAATTCAFETLRSGQHVVAPQIMYHGGQDWLRRISETRGIGLTFFDQTREGALEEAVRPGETALVWVESPVNPTWDVIDIAHAAAVAHAAGAILIADCTVAPPCTTRALGLGADIVFHSATKYLGGHSDVVAGALATREKNERWEEIGLVRKLTGGILGPFDAWLLLRGMRTLFLRYERASANALALARHFENHPKIERVLYPGLESHPGHEIAKRQMTEGFGGMLSILIDGDEAQAKRVASSVRLFLPATSLGGVESLIEHRKTVEGPHSLVPPNLLRLSIGIEDVRDLIADLEQALEAL